MLMQSFDKTFLAMSTDKKKKKDDDIYNIYMRNLWEKQVSLMRNTTVLFWLYKRTNEVGGYFLDAVCLHVLLTFFSKSHIKKILYENDFSLIMLIISWY